MDLEDSKVNIFWNVLFCRDNKCFIKSTYVLLMKTLYFIWSCINLVSFRQGFRVYGMPINVNLNLKLTHSLTLNVAIYIYRKI